MLTINIQMKYAVVTTFHNDGYIKYGKRMIETFLDNWPKEINLYAYHQNVLPLIQSPNLILRDLELSSPELVSFKDRWKNDLRANGGVSDSSAVNNKKSFKWDAIRFSHKVYAIFHCARNTDADILFWMDADTVCHSPINIDFIKRMTPVDKDLGFLGRGNKYTECGLYSMDLRSNDVQAFLREFQRMYDDAENGIFKLQEWHDSFVFDDVKNRTISVSKQFNWSAGLIKGEGHPLINSEWGAFLDHLKGQRKQAGRSSLQDLRIKRSESYWR
jgi:hypothetical protein